MHILPSAQQRGPPVQNTAACGAAAGARLAAAAGALTAGRTFARGAGSSAIATRLLRFLYRCSARADHNVYAAVQFCGSTCRRVLAEHRTCGLVAVFFTLAAKPQMVLHQQGAGIIHDKMIAVGDKAKMMHEKTHENIRTIRPLRDGVIADFYACEQMIRGLIKMGE